MKDKNIDILIKEIFQKDKIIDKETKDIFTKFENNLEMENKNTYKKLFKVNFKIMTTITASLVMTLFLSANLYAHIIGKPNVFSLMKSLFINQENYEKAEEDIGIMVESNGVRLTLKTVAMDDNILVLKYLAQGEKLKDEFYTYQDFEEELIVYGKMVCSLSGFNIGEDTYKNITNDDCSKFLDGLKGKLISNGLEKEDTEKLVKLGANAYSYYMSVELGDKSKSEESAKELIEQTIAMFESTSLSKNNIIKSNDTLLNINITTNSQSIEKVENGYIVYCIYNIDTLSDLNEIFNLNLNINKIGNIEGKWEYSINLNKAELNSEVEIIDFNNNYVKNVYEKYSKEDNVTEKIDVVVSRLFISDFSSVLNIRTEAYLDNPNLLTSKELFNNKMFPLIYIITDKDENVIGTCNSNLNSNEIIDDLYDKRMNRILLKNVDKNTEEIKIKIYTSNDNKLIGTFNINLLNEKNNKIINENDENLEGIYSNSEFGIKLNYPKNWKIYDNGTDWGKNAEFEYRTTSICINTPNDQDGYYAQFGMLIWKKDDQDFYLISPEDAIETGNINIDGIKTTFRITNRINGNIKNKDYEVCVNKNNMTYVFTFGGRESLYIKYFETFEKILKTIKISDAKIEIINIMEQNSNELFETEEINVDNTYVNETNVDKQAEINDYNNKITNYKNLIKEEEEKIAKYNQELTEKKQLLKELEEHPEDGEDYENRIEAAKALISYTEMLINECNLYITMNNYSIDLYQQKIIELQI